VLIAGICGVTTVNVDAIPVLIDSAGQLGTVSSSIKYKENVVDLMRACWISCTLYHLTTKGKQKRHWVLSPKK
jgi:hypothetical protein